MDNAIKDSAASAPPEIDQERLRKSFRRIAGLLLLLYVAFAVKSLLDNMRYYRIQGTASLPGKLSILFYILMMIGISGFGIVFLLGKTQRKLILPFAFVFSGSAIVTSVLVFLAKMPHFGFSGIVSNICDILIAVFLLVAIFKDNKHPLFIVVVFLGWVFPTVLAMLSSANTSLYGTSFQQASLFIGMILATACISDRCDDKSLVNCILFICLGLFSLNFIYVFMAELFLEGHTVGEGWNAVTGLYTSDVISIEYILRMMRICIISNIPCLLCAEAYRKASGGYTNWYKGVLMLTALTAIPYLIAALHYSHYK